MNKNQTSEDKITGLFLKEVVTIPGSSVGGDTTINISKHIGVEMRLHFHGVLVMVKGKRAIIPFSNIRNIILED